MQSSWQQACQSTTLQRISAPLRARAIAQVDSRRHYEVSSFRYIGRHNSRQTHGTGLATTSNPYYWARKLSQTEIQYELPIRVKNGEGCWVGTLSKCLNARDTHFTSIISYRRFVYPAHVYRLPYTFIHSMFPRSIASHPFSRPCPCPSPRRPCPSSSHLSPARW